MGLDRWTYTDVGSAAFAAIDGASATDLIAVGGAGHGPTSRVTGKP